MVAAGLWVVMPLAVPKGTLRITVGPPGVQGMELAAAKFGFGAFEDGTEISGPLMRMEAGDWSFDTCPPKYVGSRSLAGALVVDPDAAERFACSFEKIAAAAEQENAAAWLSAFAASSSLALLAPVPGFATNVWYQGDSRSLPRIAAADIREESAGPVVDALARGDTVHAVLTVGGSVWDDVFNSPAFAVWQALISLHAAAAIELALCRLWAYWRADGGLRPTLAQLVLMLEAIACSARVAYVAVDPFSKDGTYSFPTGLMIFLLSVAAGTAASSMYLLFYASAATSAGIAVLQLTRRSNRLVFLAFVYATLAFDIATSFTLFLAYAWQLAALKMVLVAMVMPLVLLALSILALRKIEAPLKGMPAPLVKRLNRRMRQSVIYRSISFLCGLAVPWGLYGPYRAVTLFGLGFFALNGASYIHCDALRPLTERPPRGPLRMLHDAIYACASLMVEGTPPPSPVREFSVRADVVLSMHQANGGGQPAADAKGSPTGSAIVRAKSSVRGVVKSSRPAPIHPDDGDEAKGTPARPSRALGNGEASRARDADNDEDEGLPDALLKGVSLRFLREFATTQSVRSIETMGQVRERVRKLLPQGAQGPYTEERDSTRDHKPLVDRANVFVCHTHSTTLKRMVEALDFYLHTHALDKERTYFWIDVFSAPLNGSTPEAVSHLPGIEQELGAVAVVIDPWEQPAVLTRTWCLYEIVQCRVLGITLQLATCPDDAQEMVDKAHKGEKTFVERCLTRIDVRNATAGSDADVTHLMQLIERGFGSDTNVRDSTIRSEAAFAHFNADVRAVMRAAFGTWLQDMAVGPATPPDI